jgi:nitroreductase
MEFREVIRTRRSVRHFRPDPVSDEALRRVVDAARLAPSAQNKQPWRFYVATGQSRLTLGKLLAQATIHLTEYVDILGPKEHEKAVEWYTSLGEAPVIVVVTSPPNDDPFGLLTRNLSVGAALENLLLAAVDEGLAACNITYSHWVADDLSAELDLPHGWEILSVVALGHPDDTDLLSQTRRPDDTVWLD